MYTCETCEEHVDEYIRVDGNRMCKNCLFDGVNGGDLSVSSNSHQFRCGNCGSRQSADDKIICASCHECQNCSDDATKCEDCATSTCSQCGDGNAQYCSSSCAVSSDGSPGCQDCGCEIPSRCEDCTAVEEENRKLREAKRQVQQSPVEERKVNVSGITIDFSQVE